MSHFEDLQQKILSKQAKVGIVGLGYVGLPLAVEFANAGFCVTGIDIDTAKVDATLGRQPGDGAVHEAAVDEREMKSVSHPAAHSGFARSDASVDGNDHLSVFFATARSRAATSASPNTRHPPTFNRPSFNGPKPTRFSD